MALALFVAIRMNPTRGQTWVDTIAISVGASSLIMLFMHVAIYSVRRINRD